MSENLRTRLNAINEACEDAIKEFALNCNPYEAVIAVYYIKGMVDGTLGTTRPDIRKCLDSEF